MLKKCLCLKFPDNREVFTHEKHNDELTEFANTFGVKILKVEADSPILLPIEDIVNFFCDHSRETYKTNYHIETESKNTREKMLRTVYDIRAYIENELLEKRVVRIKELHKKFSKHQIAVSTIYRHLSFVKEYLSNKGHKIKKVAVGCYKIES